MELNVITKSREYPIYIGEDILDNIIDYLDENTSYSKIGIITDENVYRIYGDRLKAILDAREINYKISIIKPGEMSKSLSTAEKLYDDLLDFNITRSDVIVTFGGGVVGDLGGFVASTLLRGIPFVQVPTTLLSQIDSSVGGKVAVNTRAGKNLVGSFYQPMCVIIDVKLLGTLEDRYLYVGMAELIKYGCIRDESIIDELESFESKDELLVGIEALIYKCCSIKGDIVKRDEFDKGERMILNFGHTLGHGIEKYYDYSKYTHGEAVAIGMYQITLSTEEMGITKGGASDRIKDLLEKYNLPYKDDDMNMAVVRQYILNDKKSTVEGINIIVLKEIGDGHIVFITKDELKKYFN